MYTPSDYTEPPRKSALSIILFTVIVGIGLIVAPPLPSLIISKVTAHYTRRRFVSKIEIYSDKDATSAYVPIIDDTRSNPA